MTSNVFYMILFSSFDMFVTWTKYSIYLKLLCVPIACVKTTNLVFISAIYQNVPPAVLVRFLREHRSEWADFNVDGYTAAALKAGSYAYPGMRPTRFTGSQIIMPLGHTIEHEEVFLE